MAVPLLVSLALPGGAVGVVEEEGGGDEEAGGLVVPPGFRPPVCAWAEEAQSSTEARAIPMTASRILDVFERKSFSFDGLRG